MMNREAGLLLEISFSELVSPSACMPVHPSISNNWSEWYRSTLGLTFLKASDSLFRSLFYSFLSSYTTDRITLRYLLDPVRDFVG